MGNLLVDAFMLQYYEGFPMKEVAWGKIATPHQWQQLAQLKDGYQDSLFTSPVVAQNVAAAADLHQQRAARRAQTGRAEADGAGRPRLQYCPLLSAMQFQPYQLPQQYEKTPIGGKLVFQRWRDAQNDRELLKIEYVYQSTEQLGQGDAADAAKPRRRGNAGAERLPDRQRRLLRLERLKRP